MKKVDVRPLEVIKLKNLELIILVGCSGSGKTTWAKAHVEHSPKQWVVISRDEARRELFPEFKPHEYKHTKAREKKVSEHCEHLFNVASTKGQNVIIADTNLNPAYRELWKKRGEENGYEVIFQDFPMTYEEILQRNQYRGTTSVPSGVLLHQWKQWCEYKGRRKYTPDEKKRKAIIVDVDGTIATKGNRSPYAWDRVGEDEPRSFIIDLLRCYLSHYMDDEVIFLSGRDSVCRHETLNWIAKHMNIPIYNIHLHMREEGDMRKDSIVKEELFWGCVADNYNVLAVFDDRPQVVEMWYDIGIKNVICVADQRNRF